MDPRKKRLLPFYVIVTVIFFFLIVNIFWFFFLDEGSPLRQVLYLITVSLTLSLFIIGIIGYAIDKKFEPFDKENGEVRKKFKDFSKYEKVTTIITVLSWIIMSMSIIMGESLLLLLGPNIFTDFFIMFEYVGVGLFVIGTVLILK